MVVGFIADVDCNINNYRFYWRDGLDTKMKHSIALSGRELRERSPAWLRFIHTVDRMVLKLRRDDPLERAYDKDYVRREKG